MQTELEAMHVIARALAGIPDSSTRTRIMAWAAAAFPATEAVPAAPLLEEPFPVPMDCGESRAVEDFHSEDRPETRSAPLSLLAPVAPAEPLETEPIDDEPDESPAPLFAVYDQPTATDTTEPLSPADIEALSIKDVETMFDDTGVRHGQFAPRPYRPRTLRPRLVLRFRLWR